MSGGLVIVHSKRLVVTIEINVCILENRFDIYGNATVGIAVLSSFHRIFDIKYKHYTMNGVII